MACHLRTNDLVEIMSGDHRGSRGKILRIDWDRGVVLVEGVNVVYRHVRPTRQNPQGGRIQKEAPIHISNVLPVDSSTGRGARVHFEVKCDDAGKVVSKRRLSRSGAVLNDLTRS